MKGSAYVIDASALLAYLHGETGGPRVGDSLDGALLCSVSLCEILQKAKQFGVDIRGLEEDLAELGIRIEPFTAQRAWIAADLWESTRTVGLSLADRACLALAIESVAPVLTADRAWQALDLSVVIEAIQ